MLITRNWVQLAKALSPIDSTFGKVIFSIAVQCLKAPSSMIFTLVGITMFVSLEQLQKVSDLISFTPSGISKSVKEAQYENVFFQFR